MSDIHIPQNSPLIRGRGTRENPSGRFETQSRVTEEEDYEALAQEEDICGGIQKKTNVHTDTSKSIIATNDSPDVGMEASLNPYRGCEHGCVYCFARPTHEYLGLSAGVDFETQIFAKLNAAELLAQKLSSKSWQPKVLMLSGVTDCYQPLEKKMRLTRGCLEVLNEFRNPASIVTKNHLVTRDIDIFQSMNEWRGIGIMMSITTLDGKLARLMEPRASQPPMRLRAIEMFAKYNIPVGVIIGPVLPGLTDHEIPAILKAAANAGATRAHYTMLRLPHGVKNLFQTWLLDHYPDRAEKVINHVRDTRGGKLYDSSFETRMHGTGLYAENIASIFKLYKNKYGLNQHIAPLSTAHFNRDARAAQLSLF
jgi:DNA repair photolyase